MSEAHFRRSARRPVELRASFRKDEAGASLEKAGRISDLGMGGAFVEHDRPLAAGTRMVLTLSSPSAWDPLEVPCEVRWVRDAEAPRGMGVRFVALTKPQANALYDLLVSTGYVERDPTPTGSR